MTDEKLSARATNTLSWLERSREVAIPVYQREYRWTIATCATLLSDIRSVAPAPEGETHFIGSILAKPDSVEPEGAVTLVDGQQRVTTLLLLLAAVAEAAEATDPDTAAQIRRLVSSAGHHSRGRLRPHARFAVEVDTLLLSGSAARVPHRTAFSENYSYLLEQVAPDWRLVWAGLRKLEHVVIELGARSSAQQVFESLNSTGIPLSDDELIHNYVHMGRSHADQVAFEERVWTPIEEATQGHTREFWRDYLILTGAKAPDFSGSYGIFRAFKEHYPRPNEDVDAKVEADWLRYANRYSRLLCPELEIDHSVAQQLRFLNWFGGTPRPLTLAAYDDYSEGAITRSVLVESLERLQALLIRRAVAGLERDTSMIWQLCRSLRDGGYPISGIVERTPEDAAIRLRLTASGVPHATYVLRRLQLERDINADLQVEHIHPQNPRAEWSGDGVTSWASLPVEEQAEFKALLNTIGNLTLLEADINQGASNRSFREKASYYAASVVDETKSLAGMTSWDRQAIRHRTSEMIDRFLSTWPRPGDAPMTIEEELVRVVDLDRPALRGYPAVFEYARFGDDVWGGVRTSKELLVRLVDELVKRDPQAVSRSQYGELIVRQREPRKSYAPLSDGRYLYTGWAHQYLLEVAQAFVTAFRLEDQVRVKRSVPASAGA